jgi:hypothetical protein
MLLATWKSENVAESKHLGTKPLKALLTEKFPPKEFQN